VSSLTIIPCLQGRHDVQLVEDSIAVEVPFGPACRLAGLVFPRLQYLDNIQLVEQAVPVGVAGGRLRVEPDLIVLVSIREKGIEVAIVVEPRPANRSLPNRIPATRLVPGNFAEKSLRG
jgi:hypothetical protein